MDVQWVKIRSWHAVKDYDLARDHTYCGRLANGAVVVDELPTERSCESCLRILARREDR